VARVTAWATATGCSVDQVVSEVGSARNAKRAKFPRLLWEPTVTTIIVEHRVPAPPLWGRSARRRAPGAWSAWWLRARLASSPPPCPNAPECWSSPGRATALPAHPRLPRPPSGERQARPAGRFPSSQLHHGCGCRLAEPKKMATHLLCAVTGELVDRDITAAKNLRDWPASASRGSVGATLEGRSRPSVRPEPNLATGEEPREGVQHE